MRVCPGSQAPGAAGTQNFSACCLHRLGGPDCCAVLQAHARLADHSLAYQCSLNTQTATQTPPTTHANSQDCIAWHRGRLAHCIPSRCGWAHMGHSRCAGPAGLSPHSWAEWWDHPPQGGHTGNHTRRTANLRSLLMQPQQPHQPWHELPVEQVKPWHCSQKPSRQPHWLPCRGDAMPGGLRREAHTSANATPGWQLAAILPVHTT